jgi:hypothetical protein
VLTLLVTRQGTSMTIVDNSARHAGRRRWGQRLFFNKSGQRAPLTAERCPTSETSGVTMNGESAQSLGADANLLMIVQVPLKYGRPSRRKMMAPMDSLAYEAFAAARRPRRPLVPRGAGQDVGRRGRGARHGPELGPYAELDGLTIERDPRFPVRVTVQFYQATSNGVLAAADVKNLRGQIKKCTRSGLRRIAGGADRRRSPAPHQLGRRIAASAGRDDAGLPRPRAALAGRQAHAAERR